MPERETPSGAEETAPDRSGLAGVSPPRRRRRFRLLAVVIAPVIVVLLVWPLVSLLQPTYYERYPHLRERMDNWRVSTHGRMTCAGCHIEPGVRGHLEFAARSIPAFYSQLIEGPHEENLFAPPGREACQQCHTSFRQVSADGDLLIPHRAHVEILEIDCVQCHSELVHAESPEGFNRPSMRGCLEQCHDGEIARAECVNCHTRKHVPDDHLREDWLEIHARMVETQDCGECHAWTPDYCQECHARRPASHAGNWKTAHSERARVRAAGCMVCHSEESCRECH
ncbi:MAG TPA: hypothetical protein VFH17_03435 [Coriobacteriia bacterium]|nr:hypothetical protein [Coriobacteriia bacterium]